MMSLDEHANADAFETVCSFTITQRMISCIAVVRVLKTIDAPRLMLFSFKLTREKAAKLSLDENKSADDFVTVASSATI